MELEKKTFAYALAFIMLAGLAHSISFVMNPASGGSLGEADTFTLTMSGATAGHHYYLMWALTNGTGGGERLLAMWEPSQQRPVTDSSLISNTPPPPNFEINPTAAQTLNCAHAVADCAGHDSPQGYVIAAYVHELDSSYGNVAMHAVYSQLANRPPTMPSPPSPAVFPISGPQGTTFTVAPVDGSLPPEEGQTVYYQYKWEKKDGTILQAYSASRTFACTAASGCANGDIIVAYALACDNLGACTQTQPSPDVRVNVDLPVSVAQTSVTAIGQYESGGPQSPFGTGSNFYSVGWFSDWRAMGMIAVVISLLIVALAYMFGIGFGLQEIKAWAGLELGQAVGSLIIIVALIGFMAFIDTLSIDVASSTMNWISPGTCNPASGQPCAMIAAETYINQLIGVATDSARNNLKESLDAAKASSVRQGLQTFTVYTLWAGGSWAPNAGRSMDVDKQNILFDYHSKIIASLTAQKYFLEVATFGIAPAFLLIGVLCRTFFFTRRLGGLLMAIAVALMIVYPLTYVFSWLTLYVSVYGSNATSAPANCPAECKTLPPVAFYTDASGLVLVNTTRDLATLNVDVNTYTSKAGFTTCDNIEQDTGIPDSLNACRGCPPECRELPYPFANPSCSESACSQCDKRCKVVRYRTDCKEPTIPESYCPQVGDNSCSLACRVTLPMEGTEYHYDVQSSTGSWTTATTPATRNPQDDVCSGCAGCPVSCRTLVCDENGLNCMPPDITKRPECGAPACNVNVCPEECRFKMRNIATASCNGGGYFGQSLCSGCPDACRVNATGNRDVDSFYQQVCMTGANAAACAACPDICKAQPGPDAGNETCALIPTTVGAATNNCLACPLWCRWTDLNFAACNETPISDYCSDPSCATDCRIPDYKRPKICPAFDDTQPNHGNTAWSTSSSTAAVTPTQCSDCPNNCRFRIHAVNDTNPAQVLYDGLPEGCPSACETNCPMSCFQTIDVTYAMPSGPSPVACEQFISTTWSPGPLDPGLCPACPWECRYTPLLSGAVASCDTQACLDCRSESCTYDRTPLEPTICSPYYGYWNQIDKQVYDGYSYQTYYKWVDNASDVAIGSRSTAVADFNDIGFCKQCPTSCRIVGENYNCGLDPGYSDCSEGACPNACRVSLPMTAVPPLCQDFQGFKQCFDCPAHCRIANAEGLVPDPYCANMTSCNSEQCADLCRAKLPEEPCKGCVECDPDCTQMPTVRTNCAELCEQSEFTGPATLTPQDFLTQAGGATGDAQTKAVGILLIPALVLPLFSIVIVIATVRGLSPVLGGDIEIPGIARLI